jgi:hypothetical protein
MLTVNVINDILHVDYIAQHLLHISYFYYCLINAGFIIHFHL